MFTKSNYFDECHAPAAVAAKLRALPSAAGDADGDADGMVVLSAGFRSERGGRVAVRRTRAMAAVRTSAHTPGVASHMLSASVGASARACVRA